MVRLLCALSLAALLFSSGCGESARGETTDISISNDISEERYSLEELSLADIGMASPGGLCLFGGDIYVTDVEKHCVFRLDGDFRVIGTYGEMGMEAGNFTAPTDIAYSAGSFYVLDNGNRRVQQFTTDFVYIGEFPLGRLYFDQGGAQYLSIVLDGAGVMYVSALAFDKENAYLYRWNGENRAWDRLGDSVVGYLCEADGRVYFANMFEYSREGNAQSFASGANYLYEINGDELSVIGSLYDGLQPVALAHGAAGLYMVGVGPGTFHYFDGDEMHLFSFLRFPRVSKYMGMAIGDGGDIYVTDSENKAFYRIRRR